MLHLCPINIIDMHFLTRSNIAFQSLSAHISTSLNAISLNLIIINLNLYYDKILSRVIRFKYVFVCHCVMLFLFQYLVNKKCISK